MLDTRGGALTQQPYNCTVTDIINLETKAMLLAAGYAIVAMDVRGTGASFGQWPHPWHETERQDSLCVVEWIVAQPWSDGNVCLYGISYDCNAALFTLVAEGQRRQDVGGNAPATSPIKAVAALYPFFDLYRDVAAPGTCCVLYHCAQCVCVCVHACLCVCV